MEERRQVGSEVGAVDGTRGTTDRQHSLRESIAVPAQHRAHHLHESRALGRRDRTDLAEVDQAEPAALEGDDIARMRVSVEEIGLEDHHCIGLQYPPSEPSSISPYRFQPFPIAKRNALDPVHDQYRFVTHVVHHPWDRDGVAHNKRTTDGFEVVGFCCEVGLATQQDGELVHDCNRVVCSYSGRKARDEAGGFLEAPKVLVDISKNPWTAYL